GVAAGMGLLLVRVSEMPSYLSDDPRACINCHIMRPHYSTWEHSSHRQAATCNDCHVPHDSVIRTYAFKAKDGLRHAAIFTLRGEPQVIRATPASAAVIQENCVRCHERQLAHTSLPGQGRACATCHDHVPHGDARSLSATPDALVPRLAPLLSRPSGDATP
ncbi:MAG TPA: cytochrome c nitrite reductase small subunit, partial [Armatimonadota bacterium]|nr:cytochrome c nitrite reductase small subunit [Armatimonadota bacterium]